MNEFNSLPFAPDVIGPWSQIKLDIVREYAVAYSRILNSQKNKLSPVYIDAFSGAGLHFDKFTGKPILGSALNALAVDPPFNEVHLIDLDGDKVDALSKVAGHLEHVHLYNGDCNNLLLESVFPQVQYKEYKRGLCLLDPYGLQLDWQVIEQAGKQKSIEVFLNFPIMDMQRNALLINPERASQKNISRMNLFWGDESWREVTYRKPDQISLFPDEHRLEKIHSTIPLLSAFADRLRDVAGFKYVPDPVQMKNSKGNTLYYLFFASHNPTGAKIARDVFKKHRERAR